MMKNVLIKSSFIVLMIFYSFSCLEHNQTRKSKKFIVQDSLITNNNFFKRVVYFGYTKKDKDTTKWNDVIKICHIKKKGYNLKKRVRFF
jgi:hypothetical protein